MTAYTLTEPVVGLRLAGLLGALVVLGGLLTRATGGWRRPIIWCLPFGGIVVAERLSTAEPAGVRMIALCLALLYGMKGIVGTESTIAGERPLSIGAWLVFCLGWFGMRPAVFATFPGPRRSGVRALLVQSAQAFGMGLGCLLLSTWFESSRFSHGGLRVVAVLVPLMVALSLIVHFALFDLLAATWRALGANARKLFRRPIVSRSLTEFWGRRWNLAFSEMTAIAVFRPLKPVAGTGVASVVAFLFSGLLHELAISVPVRAGYGLPFAYFVLHAVAMRLEAGACGRWLKDHPWTSRAWTFAWLLVPLPLLFHGPFVRGVLLPIVGA